MAYEKKTGFAESFDGTRIYYEVRGEGLPLVLCYGIVCTMNHWHEQIREFSDRYQTILIDYRGHHHSDIPQNQDNLSMDGLAQDILCVIDHLKIKKASFWGHSFGVQTLIRAYDMFPERFENLVFINGFATNPLKGMFGLDLSYQGFLLLKQGYSHLPETSSYLWRFLTNNRLSMMLTAFAGGFNLDLTSFKDVEIYARGVANIEVGVAVKLFDQMTRYDARPVLERIQVPTLVIGGRKDNVTPLHLQEVLHTGIKNSQFLAVPYGTHCTQLDMPDLVNLAIEKFLHENAYEPHKKKKPRG